MDNIAKKLHFNNMEDFYSLSRADLFKHGGVGVYQKYKSLGNLLKAVYPEYPHITLQNSISKLII